MPCVPQRSITCSSVLAIYISSFRLRLYCTSIPSASSVHDLSCSWPFSRFGRGGSTPPRKRRHLAHHRYLTLTSWTLPVWVDLYLLSSHVALRPSSRIRVHSLRYAFCHYWQSRYRLDYVWYGRWHTKHTWNASWSWRSTFHAPPLYVKRKQEGKFICRRMHGLIGCIFRLSSHN
jgi:hypothetical protein